MANIIINVDELECQEPVINSIDYIAPSSFNFKWTSQGDVYSQTNPETTMTLRMQIFEPSSGIVLYDSIIDNSAPFNTANYQINVLDYAEFSSKYRFTFKLTLSNNYCTVSTTKVIPENTLPNG